MLFISLLGIFMMYMINVASQNFKYEHGDFTVNSGLANGFYQQMVVYILNGAAILYFTTFVFKSPSQEGYELILASKKINRVKLFISRVLIVILFAFILSTLQLAFLSIPATVDIVMEKGENIKWLFSNYLGNIIVGLIASFIFVFFSTVGTMFVSVILGTSTLAIVPLVSVMMYEMNTADDSKVDEWYTASGLGSYSATQLTERNIIPRVNGEHLIYDTWDLHPLSVKAVNANGKEEGLSKVIKEYSNSVKYQNVYKGDAWNSFKGFYNIFSNHKYHSGYSYRDYKVKTLKQIIPNLNPNIGEVFINKDNISLNAFQTMAISRKTNGEIKDSAFYQNLFNIVVKLFDDNPLLYYLDDRSASFIMNFYEPQMGKLEDFVVKKDVIYNPDGTVSSFSGGIPDHIELIQPFRDKVDALYKENPNFEIGKYLSNFINKKYINRPATDRRVPNPLLRPDGEIKSPDTAIFKVDSKFMTVEEKNFPEDTPWTYIIPVISILLVVLAGFITTRKDIK